VLLAAGSAAGLVATLLAGCDSGTSQPAAPSATSAPTAAPSPATPSPQPGTPATGIENNGATPAPSWLGTRVLPIGPDGFGIAKGTPPELRNRRIVTTDVLPPPAGGRFHSRIVAVPASVAERSSWSSACPVRLSQLRYVTVAFRGFDGRAHTGELLLNRSVATKVVTVFRRLFAAGWPIEEMRITSAADLSAPPTGDGNDTSAFACRPVRGATVWSQHAYGLAIDVDPFQNPYVDGRTVLPELAKWYADRSRRLPGVITPGSVPVLAFASVGWGWGGRYSSKKDWMHFSSTGK
jgi:D-alanyl-D-alanine carboxypeptidase